VKETILTLPTPFGEPLELVKFHWEGGKNGDSLSLVSGLHGDHLNGLFVNQRLIRFLDQVAEGRNPDYQLAGRVQIFPVVNLHALAAGQSAWPFDNLDMDLAFPGSLGGEATERAAGAVRRHSSDSTFGLLLKSATTHYEDTPHVQCFHPDRWERKLAAHLGLGIVREIPAPPTFRLQLLYQWIVNEVTGYALSAGRPGIVDTGMCDRLFSGIVAFMVKTGLLKYSGGSSEPKPSVYYRTRDENTVLSPCAGWFLPEVAPGACLKQGERLGEIRDLQSGETLEEILAPKDGALVTLRCYPVIYEGEPVATVLEERKPGIWPF